MPRITSPQQETDLDPKPDPSVTFPLLPTDRNQPIEQLFPQWNRREPPRFPLLRHNFHPVRNLLISGPAHDDLRLPAQPTDLLQLLDILDRDAENRLERSVSIFAAYIIRGVCRE